MKQSIFLVVFSLMANMINANIVLPEIFSDHMVLQQEEKVPFWGWGKPLEEVKITCSWNPDTTYSMKIPSNAKWELEIETPKAGGPHSIYIQGYNEITIDDVMIGEVWLGSGQSNMEWSVSAQVEHGEEEKALADFPEIRFFSVLTGTSEYPQDDLHGEWVVCTPETMWNFSAVLYFFGKEIYNNLDVPVGLINSSWGGTPAETWVRAEILNNNIHLKKNADLLDEDAPWCTYTTGAAYNAMIHPLHPYKIKGSLWYQGETNTANPHYYEETLTLLIESWRASWGYDFPFYLVQIAPFDNYGNDNVNGAIVRDQQRLVSKHVPNTGMVVVSDIGNLKDIHPRNKRDVGKRLANLALTKTYGKVGLPFSGPTFKDYEFINGDLVIYFDHAEGGLKFKGKLSDHLELLKDGQWSSVSALVKGSNIVVDKVLAKDAEAVRFAYKNNSTPGFFNQQGLPASCFKFEIDK